VDYSFKLDEEFTMFYPILNETVKVSDVPKASVFLGAQLTASGEDHLLIIYGLNNALRSFAIVTLKTFQLNFLPLKLLNLKTKCFEKVKHFFCFIHVGGGLPQPSFVLQDHGHVEGHRHVENSLLGPLCHLGKKIRRGLFLSPA
jgi:hypothetical protein